jgi:hypothetical protein
MSEIWYAEFRYIIKNEDGSEDHNYIYPNFFYHKEDVEEFRLDYCHKWDSLINNYDKKNLKKILFKTDKPVKFNPHKDIRPFKWDTNKKQPSSDFCLTLHCK